MIPALTKPLEAIYQPIQSGLACVEEMLRDELRGVNGFLGEVTQYVAGTLGKRLRPALALLSAQAVTPPPDVGPSGRRSPNAPPEAGTAGGGVIQMAAAVELIHTATLIHDDVIDDAYLRRGKATVNARWGNTLSVLAGDYLYSQAFCLLSAVGSPEILDLMSRTSQRVCVGEVTQVRHRFDVDLDEATYLAIIREKTASLMAAACQGAALLTGAPAQVSAALAAFGHAFGIAFQIVDDTHDLLGDEDRFGKSLGTDLAQGKLTLPMILLRDAVDPATRRRVRELLQGNGNGHAAAIQAIQALARSHDIAATCFAKARGFADEARAALGALAPSDARQGLLDLADFILAP